MKDFDFEKEEQCNLNFNEDEPAEETEEHVSAYDLLHCDPEEELLYEEDNLFKDDEDFDEYMQNLETAQNQTNKTISDNNFDSSASGLTDTPMPEDNAQSESNFTNTQFEDFNTGWAETDNAQSESNFTNTQFEDFNTGWSETDNKQSESDFTNTEFDDFGADWTSSDLDSSLEPFFSKEVIRKLELETKYHAMHAIAALSLCLESHSYDGMSKILPIIEKLIDKL